MLFQIGPFEEMGRNGPTLNSLKNLYKLNVFNAAGQRGLKIRHELFDQFVFCQAISEADGIRIAVDQQLSWATLWWQVKQAGKITGLDHVANPFFLRDMTAESFHDSCKSTSSTYQPRKVSDRYGNKQRM